MNIIAELLYFTGIWEPGVCQLVFEVIADM